jgi:hypothetical protein
MANRARALAAAGGFLAASTLLHGLILRAPDAALEIEPAVARCNAGQAIRLAAVLRTGSRRSPLHEPADWAVRAGRIRFTAPGLLVCEGEGEAVVTARKGRLSGEGRVQVGPAIMMVEASPPPSVAPLLEPPAVVRLVRRASPPPSREVEPAPSEAPPDPAPAAARAAELLTAEHPPEAAEPDQAVSEAGSAESGLGVVAVGGVAAVGAKGARADGVVGGTGAGPAGPVADLSRPPAITDPDPCRGYFPDEAQADAAVLEMDVDVAADGHVRRASVRGESPPGQGFGSAARQCFSAMRLEPAVDRAGRPTAGRMTFRFRFAR